MMPNTFSPKWFELFLEGQPRERTALQLGFIQRQFPLPEFKVILDVPSGPGRHSGPLAAIGYKVIAMDVDGNAIGTGVARWPNVDFRELDMRELEHVSGPVDGIICLWQSFGFFDSATNRRVFEQMANLLRRGGRMMFDLYRRDFFHQGREITSEHRHAGDKAVSISRLEGTRLRVRIKYESGGADHADWELLTPEEMSTIGQEVGLRTLITCAYFDETIPTTKETRDFQILFEKQ